MQKEIQLTDKTLLVVGLPKEANYPKLSNSFLIISVDSNSQKVYQIPQGDWQLLGIYPELTEEMAKMVVDLPQYEHYFNYSYKNAAFKWLRTAKESFQSLMEREKCYIVNPYSEFECPNQWCENGYIDQGYGDKWRCEFCQDNEDKEDEAQQTTFDKFAILIKSK